MTISVLLAKAVADEYLTSTDTQNARPDTDPLYNIPPLASTVQSLEDESNVKAVVIWYSDVGSATEAMVCEALK